MIMLFKCKKTAILMSERDIPPIHPGEHLQDFLTELNLSQYALAKALHVDVRRINLILHGKRAITADTSMRLGRFFGQDDGFWLRLQEQYDLETARTRSGEQIMYEVVPYAVAFA
jgi:addiction module HigA family antidote